MEMISRILIPKIKRDVASIPLYFLLEFPLIEENRLCGLGTNVDLGASKLPQAV